MEDMESKNDSALSKNEAAIERLRTTIEKNARTLLLEIAVLVSVGVAITSLVVGFIVKS